MHTLEGHKIVNSAYYKPNGSQIVTFSGYGAVRIWDTKSGELLNALAVEGHTDYVYSTVYNATGSQIVTTSWKTARIWDANTGKLLDTLKGHKGSVWSAEYNATGSQIVTASDDNTARIWDAESGDLLHTLEGIQKVLSQRYITPQAAR